MDENDGSSSSWFHGFTNAFQRLAQSALDTRRATGLLRRPSDTSESIDPNDAPPTKRARLSEEKVQPSPVHESEMLDDATNDTETVAVLVSDTVKQAVMMNVTVKREAINAAENTDNDSEVWSINDKRCGFVEVKTKPNSDAESFGNPITQHSLENPSEAEIRPDIDIGHIDIFEAETMVKLPSAAEKPKMYFDWLDKATLVKIFEHLDLFDLLQMSDEDARIAQIIAEEIMASRDVLNISEISPHYSVRHAFKHFGGFVSELVINQSDIQWKDESLSEIEEIVRLIEKRCSEGNLKRLTITFDKRDTESCELRTIIPGCFKAIESLTIVHDTFRSDNFDRCIETMLSTCTGLKSLTLHRIGSNCKFLTALNASSLEKLSFDNCCFTESNFWLEFVQKGIPSLKTLIWNNVHIDYLSIYEELFRFIAMAFPHLEELSIDSWNIKEFIEYTKLPQTTCLKILHLKCSLHNFYVPEALKQMWYLRELYIEFDDSRMSRWAPFTEEHSKDWRIAMQHMRKLEIIEIHSSKYRHDWSIFIDMVANLPCVRLVTLNGNRSLRLKDIENIVSCSPDIIGLKLDAPIGAFTPKLYNTLVRDRRRWYRKSETLYIFANAHQVARLKKGIDGYDQKSDCIGLRPIEL